MGDEINGRLSSDSNYWATPWDVFEPLAEEFNFRLDAAASHWNAKPAGGAFISKEEDALTVDWAALLGRLHGLRPWKPEKLHRIQRARTAAARGAVWLNPPYGRARDIEGRPFGGALLDPFIRKAYEESRKGLTVVVLCFARPDTALWEDVIMRASEVRFIRSRVKFAREDGATGPAPAPSCLVIFRPGEDGPPRFSVWHRRRCPCPNCKERINHERESIRDRPRDSGGAQTNGAPL